MRLEKKDYQLHIAAGSSPLPSKTSINFDSRAVLRKQDAYGIKPANKGLGFQQKSEKS